MKNIIERVLRTAILSASTAYFGYLGYINPDFKIPSVEQVTQNIDEKKVALGAGMCLLAIPYLLSRLIKKNKPEDLAYYSVINTSVILNLLDVCYQDKGLDLESIRQAYLPLTFLVPTVYYMITNDLQGYNPPQIMNYFKAKYLACRLLKQDDDLESALNLLEELKEVHKKPSSLEAGYFLAYAKAGDCEKAMQHYFKALKEFTDKLDKHNIYKQIVHVISTPLAEKLKLISPIDHLLCANTAKALEFFNKKSQTIHELCAYANTIEEIVKNYDFFKQNKFPSKQDLTEQARKVWEKAVQEIEKQKINTAGVKENKVFIVDPKDSVYLSNFFIFKPSTQNDLTEIVEKEVINDEFGVGEKITECYFRDQKCSIYRFKEGRLLIESSTEDFIKAARFLARIHIKIRSKKDRNYFDLLEQRIQSDVYEGIRVGVVSEIKQIINTLNGNAVFDKDATAKNWIVGEKGKIIAIDFEDKGNINQYRDLVKLIESGQRKSIDEKWNIADAYFDEFGKDLCKKSHLTASLLEPLNAFYFLTDFNKDMFENYLANAKRNSEELKKTYQSEFPFLEKVYARLLSL